MQFDSEVGKNLTGNARFIDSGKAFKDAAYMQSKTEHDKAIRKFTRERERQFIRAGMTPAQIAAAKERAAQWAKNYDEPKKIEKYWKGDQEPRRDIQISSSFIGGVRIVPSLGLARLNLGGRSYSYSLTPRIVGNMVTSNSLGSYYNSRIKQKKAHLTKNKALGW